MQPFPDRNPKSQAPKRAAGNRTDLLKIKVFVAFMAFFSLLGLCWFLRPTESALEKRELTPFPRFNTEDFASGEYFAQLSLWYSDTFPFREAFIGANNRLKAAYGLRSEQLVGSPDTGEDIPDVTLGTGSDIVITGTAQTGTLTATAPVTDTSDPQVTDPVVTSSTATTTAPVTDPEPERSGNLYIVGDSAFDLYYFSTASADRYAALVSHAGEKLAGTAQVYDLLIPLSYSLKLTEDTQKKIGVSDGEAAIRYMFSKMNDRVTTVPIFATLNAHKEEYLYFRTDHHWTALAAYYSYCVFCTVKGIEPTPLSSYAVTTYDGFLGTHYSATGSPRLRADTITAYLPMATNTIYITDRSGKRQKYSQGIVTPDIGRIYAAKGSQYNGFIMGDNPLSEIYNPNKTDGSSIVIIKESFGNAFVPFLVDSYQTVYVIDYRYYGGDLATFVREHQVDDVLFINNLSATGASQRLSELERLVGD